jgi:hypothetical protein
MVCPVCKLELGAERRAGELVVTYSLRNRKPGCPSSDDPVLCSNLLPTILTMLTDGKPKQVGDA